MRKKVMYVTRGIHPYVSKNAHPYMKGRRKKRARKLC